MLENRISDNLPSPLATAQGKGLQILIWQTYEIVSEMANEDRVALEARRTGVLAVAVDTLAAGAEMKASLMKFFL